MEEKCVHRVKGETLIIYLPEELDHHTADKIRECTDELFVCKKIRDVIKIQVLWIVRELD